MFEYECRNGKKVTINPKFITSIFEGQQEGECEIYTCDGIDGIIVKESYEKVRDGFNGFMYSINTIVSVR